LALPQPHLAAFVLVLAPALARAQDEPVGDIAELSLEDLMNLEITVGSRSEQRILDTPAAVYVITGDEIRRAGHTTIQEALRMVPGFLVGHWQSTTWDAVPRGFTSAFNNNLLVMIDGVNVYDWFSPEGVVWHLQDIDVEDIERIEVVRGPSSALWGQNAVNGVVNVVTKRATETQGWKLTSVLGTTESRGGARYGGDMDGGHFRIWSLVTDHEPLLDRSTGDPIKYEDWTVGKIGYRGDWEHENGNVLSLVAEAWAARIGEGYGVSYPVAPYSAFVTDDTPENGGRVNLIWDSPGVDGEGQRAVAAYTRSNLKEVDFSQDINIVDLDWQRRDRVSEDQMLTWGLGYRWVGADLDGQMAYDFQPEQSSSWSVRAFAHDEIAVEAIDTRFVLGAQIEQNSFTGTEIQPTARAIWSPNDQYAVWGAISRAVRTPSLYETYNYSRNWFSPPTDLDLSLGNQSLDSEELVAYELGWRYHASERFSFDITGFYNDLDSLVTSEFLPPFMQGSVLVQPISYDNFGSAEAWGFEVGLDARPFECWRLRAAYSSYRQINEVDSASNSGFTGQDQFFPHNIANLRSYVDLGGHWELDTGLYYVDEISALATPSYLRADLHVGYNPTPNWRFAIGGQNLCDPTHPEDGGDLVERNLYFALTWSH
jgi:iron complex outermembrane receptor protein